ncbi:MAG: response regulator, partial [Schleiferiaceae bacterium]|nr:response regulator [Schleiferiaceae bacterium]
MARILIVEDEKAIRNVLKNILINEDKSFTIDMAEDGDVAEQILQEHTYDLVLCDI